MSYSTPATFAGQKTKSAKKQYAPLDWSLVDVVSVIEQHSSTRLNGTRSGKQYNGACPFSDCLVDTDGFIVWPDLSKHGQHYWCRGCGRTGDLINLLRELHGWSFTQAKSVIFGSESVAAPGATRCQIEARERQEEVELLRHLYPRMRAAIGQYERPQAYLRERGITLEQAQAYGLGYVPFTSETPDKQPVQGVLNRWQGRIIFPLGDASGELTFAGRTLHRWMRGMSPDQHKAWLAEHAPNHARILKTSPCGYFGYSHTTTAIHIVFCEGEFDALSLLIAGVEHVIACAQHFSSDLLPFSSETVTLAMDVDESGKKANRRLSADLRNAGVETRIVTPVNGKDWNDTHVQIGLDAIREAFKPPEVTPPVEERPEPITEPALAPDILPPCSVCGRNDANIAPPEIQFYFDDDGSGNGILFCPDCWDRRQIPTVTYTPDPEQENPPPMEQVLLHIEHIDAIKALMRGEIDGPILLREGPPSWSQDEWMKDVAKEYEALYRKGEQAKARMFLEHISRLTRVKAS